MKPSWLFLNYNFKLSLIIRESTKRQLSKQFITR